MVYIIVSHNPLLFKSNCIFHHKGIYQKESNKGLSLWMPEWLKTEQNQLSIKMNLVVLQWERGKLTCWVPHSGCSAGCRAVCCEWVAWWCDVFQKQYRLVRWYNLRVKIAVTVSSFDSRLRAAVTSPVPDSAQRLSWQPRSAPGHFILKKGEKKAICKNIFPFPKVNLID